MGREILERPTPGLAGIHLLQRDGKAWRLGEERAVGCRRRLPRLCFLGDAAECGIDPDHAIIVRRAPGHSEGAGRRRGNVAIDLDLRRGIGNEGDAPGAEPARAVGHLGMDRPLQHGAGFRCVTGLGGGHGQGLRHRAAIAIGQQLVERHLAIARPVDPDGERRAFRHQDLGIAAAAPGLGLAGEQHRSPPGIGRRRDPGIDAGRHRRQGRQAHSLGHPVTPIAGIEKQRRHQSQRQAVAQRHRIAGRQGRARQMRLQGFELALEPVLVGDPQRPAVGIVGAKRQGVEPGRRRTVLETIVALEPGQRLPRARQGHPEEPKGKADEQDRRQCQNSEPQCNRNELRGAAHHEEQR